MDSDRIIDEAAAGILPFESWERLDGESGAAFAAFCAFRDFGPERNMRKAAICYANRSEFDGSLDVGTEQRQGLKPSNSTQAIEKRYRMWRNWAVRFQWAKRAAEYDGYLDKLKQAELRKTIEAQGEKHREAAGKMLAVVIKKLDLMNPADLGNNAVPIWADTAARLDRETAQFSDAPGSGNAAGRNSGPVQGELVFAPDFNGV